MTKNLATSAVILSVSEESRYPRRHSERQRRISSFLLERVEGPPSNYPQKKDKGETLRFTQGDKIIAVILSVSEESRYPRRHSDERT